MADWYGHARTNYFRVKDKEKFDKWAKSIGDLRVGADDKGRVALFSEDEYGGWPRSIYDEETDEYEDIDIYGQVAGHLAKGAVAVFQEVGAEKLRYLTGFAVAVNAEGETVEISLDDIYRLAEPLGDEVTVAEW
jgi:hypothetical protein